MIYIKINILIYLRILIYNSIFVLTKRYYYGLPQIDS